MERLLTIMRRLRGPGGCPWDQAQTHDSLRPYLLEEAAEAVDALAQGEPGAVAEELGDVLLQVAFHAVIAEEAGSFGYEDVETAIADKLVRRHPHVFGSVEVSGADEVVLNWQAIKAEEKGSTKHPADAVSAGLPALMRAGELGKRLGWPHADEAELTRRFSDFTANPDPGALGVLLLDLTLYARAKGLEPELALRDAAEAKARPANVP